MAKISLVRVETTLVDEVPGPPWHVVISDKDGDLIPLAGFLEEKEARDYSAKLDKIIVTLQEAYEPPDWVAVVVHLHDKVGPDLL